MVGVGAATRGACEMCVMCEAVVSLTLWVLVVLLYLFALLALSLFTEHVPVFLQLHLEHHGHLIRRKDHGHSVR